MSRRSKSGGNLVISHGPGIVQLKLRYVKLSRFIGKKNIGTYNSKPTLIIL